MLLNFTCRNYILLEVINSLLSEKGKMALKVEFIGFMGAVWMAGLILMSTVSVIIGSVVLMTLGRLITDVLLMLLSVIIELKFPE